ncbi:MAG: nucleotidyltransferase family protein [Bacteroidetes bacterium]|nr:nucleotidyltransferase family protein [Bacteroidota bacterium]
MQKTKDIEQKLKKLKPRLSKDFSVEKIGYFGSYAENKQHSKSDLDIMVEFSSPIGWKFFTLEKFLEDQFGIKVDLVTPSALKKQLQERILRQIKFV